MSLRTFMASAMSIFNGHSVAASVIALKGAAEADFDRAISHAVDIKTAVEKKIDTAIKHEVENIEVLFAHLKERVENLHAVDQVHMLEDEALTTLADFKRKLVG